jgi:hypothetical protein
MIISYPVPIPSEQSGGRYSNCPEVFKFHLNLRNLSLSFKESLGWNVCVPDTVMVFFIEINSFLGCFSTLSLTFLTSEEKIVDRLLAYVMLRIRWIK